MGIRQDISYIWKQLCTLVSVVAHCSLLIFLRTLNVGEKGEKHALSFKTGEKHLPSGNLGLASMNRIYFGSWQKFKSETFVFP